jgi:hypothetical protein
MSDTNTLFDITGSAVVALHDGALPLAAVSAAGALAALTLHGRDFRDFRATMDMAANDVG